MIYADTRAALEANGDPNGSVAAERLDIAINRINKFIIENTIKHTPISNLEKAYQVGLEKSFTTVQLRRSLMGLASISGGSRVRHLISSNVSSMIFYQYPVYPLWTLACDAVVEASIQLLASLRNQPDFGTGSSAGWPRFFQ